MPASTTESRAHASLLLDCVAVLSERSAEAELAHDSSTHHSSYQSAVAAASALWGARDHLWRSGDALRTFCAVAWHVIRDNAAYLPSLVHHALICPKVERPNPIPAATARAATLRGVAHHCVGAVVVPRARTRKKPRTASTNGNEFRGAACGPPRKNDRWQGGCAEREHQRLLPSYCAAFLPPSPPRPPAQLSGWCGCGTTRAEYRS